MPSFFKYFLVLFMLNPIFLFAAEDEAEAAISVNIIPQIGLAKIESLESSSCTLLLPQLNHHSKYIVPALLKKGYKPIVSTVFITATDHQVSVERTTVNLLPNAHASREFRGYFYLSADLTFGMLAARGKLTLRTVGDLEHPLAESIKRTFSLDLSKKELFSVDELPVCIQKIDRD